MGAAQELERILRQQAGVISSRQLTGMGYSRGQIMRLTRRWQRCAPGVYLTAPLTWTSALWAGLLVGGDGAVAGMEAAAFVRGIIEDEPKEIVIWVAHARREFQLGPYRIRFRRGTRASRGTPAITTVEDTMLDTADIRPEVPAIALLTRALADGFTTRQRLLNRLRQRARQRHRALIVELCSSAGAGIESVLEYLFQRNVLRRHGLPAPARRQRRSGGRVDNVYDDYALIVELDGGRYHRDKAHDYHRDNEHMLDRDERTVRFGWQQVVVDACTSAQQVARGLQLGGWGGKRARVYCRCLNV
ncbi:type IV toxin-antitoxin system AbiEi family antitoxin domain-containing protein [uncultured Tessaracoccus sp.]|uniref:type IV toxin-antitoxin system AbiEi family antitoxin domain-containing protein n=1 Tax=uncultured Tessaracoccus sp. TaxID=905023 RepID=UPI0026119A01|nr:type IV toxin-antitoxin system AbiEi family antitoxin domain-containing protein [uncultured Tessaracoccus sp.]